MAKKIIEGPATGGTIGEDNDDSDDSGRRVKPGDTVRITAPGEPFDGAVGVVLDVVAVLPEGATLPYLVDRSDVERA